ncbi:RIP metalloprotease RseP [Helicobacter sp. MIT 00-7814]|uniref:RIP metalloprotease RseP n=1 Tax=unclassified Helicobacter TaxID=2593540 RepID=UPI000E1ECCC9|nr:MULTISPECIES: RIP metalloprotease RseP [unclassified Helicobacter]RDU54590.1 RIP metalloprotease RseP [Helicobacter sp. MIT 00-7814]RDU54649.1 RIP metalloprotease RseP [Helicobacter sp. MIT 99-10781]
MGLALALIALCFLVLFHELGHFLIARLCGIGVEVFSIGFGKKLCTFTHKGTQYAISLIPLGGYVKLKGLEYSADSHTSNTSHTLQSPRAQNADSYESKPPIVRLLVLFGGPVFNLLLGFLLYFGICLNGAVGLAPVVGGLQEDSPAQKAGILAGDRIIKIEGENIFLWQDISNVLQKHASLNALKFLIQRDFKDADSQTIELFITPFFKQGQNMFKEPQTQAFIGIYATQKAELLQFSPLQSLQIAWRKTLESTHFIAQSIAKLASGVVSVREVSGVVGMTNTLSHVAQSDLVAFFGFCALLSINLGLINLLPIPLLDGGQILFVLYEMLTRKKPNERILRLLSFFGLAFIVAIMLLGLFNDMTRLIY